MALLGPTLEPCYNSTDESVKTGRPYWCDLDRDQYGGVCTVW